MNATIETTAMIHPQELNPGDQWRGGADLWIVKGVTQTLDGRVMVHFRATESGPGGWMTWRRGDLVRAVVLGPKPEEVEAAQAQVPADDEPWWPQGFTWTVVREFRADGDTYFVDTPEGIGFRSAHLTRVVEYIEKNAKQGDFIDINIWK